MATENKKVYTDDELRAELKNVFDSVYFVNKRAKRKLSQSYSLNFDTMIDYARENKIDEIEYVRGIRKILLTCPYTYKAR